jgi:SAM-dependent methyltransferase
MARFCPVAKAARRVSASEYSAGTRTGLTGRLVLDVGAGTGAVFHRLVAAGAHAIAVEASWPMLAHRASSRPPAVVGDITRLPMVDGAVDGAAAAFVLNHLADPAALVELRRVVRPGVHRGLGVLDRRPGTGEGCDRWRSRHGGVGAAGVVSIPQVGRRLARLCAHRARRGPGRRARTHIDVVEGPVQTGVNDPRDIVRYRLSQPQRCVFLAGLDADARRRVVEERVTAVTELGEAFGPGIVLAARA